MSSIIFSDRLSPADSGHWLTKIAPRLKQAVAHEFYTSDVTLSAPHDSGYVKLEGAKAGAIRITAYSSPGETRVSRTWNHVREDNFDFYVLWFVTNGTFEMRQGSNRGTVTPTSFGLTCSNRPASFLARPTGNSYNSVHVVVPSHIMLECLPQAPRLCGRAFPLSPGMASVSFKIFMSVFCEAECLPTDIATQISHQAIEGLSRVAASEDSEEPLTPKEERTQRLLDYVQLHLSEPNLTSERIASANRMSTRNLHRLLADKGTNLRNEIWGRRLVRAHDLLTDARYQRLSVNQISYMIGFKSAAHFSRSFCKRYGVAPSEVRRQIVADISDPRSYGTHHSDSLALGESLGRSTAIPFSPPVR